MVNLIKGLVSFCNIIMLCTIFILGLNYNCSRALVCSMGYLFFAIVFRIMYGFIDNLDRMNSFKRLPFILLMIGCMHIMLVLPYINAVMILCSMIFLYGMNIGMITYESLKVE